MKSCDVHGEDVVNGIKGLAFTCTTGTLLIQAPLFSYIFTFLLLLLLLLRREDCSVVNPENAITDLVLTVHM